MRVLQTTALCWFVLVPVFAPAAPLYSDTLTNLGYPANLDDGQFRVGFSKYENSGGQEFLAWCVLRGVPQVGLGQNFAVNVFRLDDQNLWTLLPATHQQLRIMAFLGNNFNDTNPNDAEVHHGIWEQLEPDYRVLNAPEQARVDAAAFFTALPPSDPLYFSTANFLVAMPVGWGTVNSVGQPIMWQGSVPQGEEAVPEPGTSALLGGGMLLVLLRRRR